MDRRRRELLVAWLAALAVLLAGSVLACGPSYQALYEGDARFEHCYALEESGAVTMAQKRDCWRSWMAHNTYGQTRDRVEYAADRYRALARAPQAPTDEAMMEAAPGEARPTSITAPAPTSAFAPPPKTSEGSPPAQEESGGIVGIYADAGSTAVDAGPGFTEESAPQPPGSACATGCDATWNRCRDCDGGTKCVACTVAYKKCMRGCFAR